MLDAGQNWQLFGYDMRNLGRHWLAAWRELLWSYDSPVRKHLDEPVVLRSPSGSACYQAGEPSAASPTACNAVLLPDDRVLSRVLTLPLEVESDIDDVIALEVNANSPFSQADTGYGWRIIARTEQQLTVVLVIVSMSAAMTYIAQQYGSHDAHAQEAWVEIDGKLVVVGGFGEGTREQLYRKRLLRVGATIALGALLLLLIGAVGAGFKRLELRQLESLASATERESAEAARMRSSLVQANETIAAFNAVTAGYPPVHRELARITELLGDDAYLERFGMAGLELDLRGVAADAAAVMELLTRQESYTEVTAASPIRRLPGANLEQFHLKVQLRGDGA